MDSNALVILLGTGLVSFLLGTGLRRLWLRRRSRKAQALLRTMQEIARQRQQNEPESLNKAKRKRQQRERSKQASGRS